MVREFMCYQQYSLFNSLIHLTKKLISHILCVEPIYSFILQLHFNLHILEFTMETILSHKEACRVLSISKPTLYRLTKKGMLQKIKISEGRVGWLQSSIQAYIDRCRLN